MVAGFSVDFRDTTLYDASYDVIFMTDPGLLILASLAEGDKHGYGIMLDVQQFAGVELGPGTLYGAITRLAENGWIRPLESNDKRRRPYRITAEGRTQLQEEMTRIDRVVKTALGRLKHA
jgi:DNA-binding PadR family transcriptional regulator